MPGARSLLIAAGLCAALAPLACAGEDEVRLLFTGDILLSREVKHEIDRTGRFPWEPFATLFHVATWVAGNLEGAVGDERDCLPTSTASPCFAIPLSLVPMLSRAGFRAIGIANNHAIDLGAAGHEATRQALTAADIEPLAWDDSPHFVRAGPYDIAVIAISTVPARDGSRAEIPSTELRQKLRLARNLADAVVVFIHWGSELLDWPDAEQRRAAEWLVHNGADLVIGHHPHVVQEPECIAGRPVFFSLGNHLFDQKYPATKRGLIADCRIQGGVLHCDAIGTATPTGSSFPQLDGAVSTPPCDVRLRPPPTLNGFTLRASNGYVIAGSRSGARAWHSRALPLLSAETGPGYLFTLERHPSTLDGEDGVRPYVYDATDHGLVARWRGSALAWPLLDAMFLPEDPGILCALHRGDSFLVLQPGARGTRTAAYRWNGFGFSGIDDPAALAQCSRRFGH
jgi:poly-gamma-glutamate synthesis protein (capsule biosynthesis protein)